MAAAAIFIGYRRDDTADIAGRLHDVLSDHLGKRRVFMDVDNLRPGVDFGEYIRAVLPRCRIALILIGPHWLGSLDERGVRRLDDPDDWVRIEIETALQTPEVDVVPVLVNGVRMPRAEELPESIRPLLRRHAAIIRRDPDFHDDVGKLISALQPRLPAEADAVDPHGARKPRITANLTRRLQLALFAAAGTLGVIALVAWQPWRMGLPAPKSTMRASEAFIVDCVGESKRTDGDSHGGGTTHIILRFRPKADSAPIDRAPRRVETVETLYDYRSITSPLRASVQHCIVFSCPIEFTDEAILFSATSGLGNAIKSFSISRLNGEYMARSHFDGIEPGSTEDWIEAGRCRTE